MYTIRIKEGREKLLVKHHPWVFSGAIEHIDGREDGGGFARVEDHEGAFIAYGYYDSKSHIVLHLLSWDEDDTMDEAFIRSLVRKSVLRRRDLLRRKGTTALRLIHGDADFLPGIAADCYGREIRMIVSSRFADRFLPAMAAELEALLHPVLIEATVDKAYAGPEGLQERIRTFREGNECSEDLSRPNARFIEDGILYEAAPGRGQKSGFYCDQRDNRHVVETYAEGRRVLDLFSYTGGFTLHALRGGAAAVDAVDSSESALRHLLYQVHINEDEGIIPSGSRERVTITDADCFDYIRQVETGKYDLMILDPPKLAKTKSGLESAMRAYKDLNRVAMTRIKDGGIIATFSCSAAMTRENFRMMLSWAAADAGVEIQLLQTLGAGEDHPVRLSCPETEYLKGAAIRVIRT